MSTVGSRKKPNILITGSPGVGKSAVAQKVANSLGFTLVNVSQVALENEFIESYDEGVDSFNLDEDRLLDYLETGLGSHDGGIIVEYHACELFPERWFDIVIILRCDNTVLFDRLTSRGYSEQKIKENVECEIFGTIAEEAHESYPKAAVHELPNNNEAELEENVQNIMCKMWESIRYGVRWIPMQRFALASRAINLKNVEKVHISLDPFHPNNNSLRYFWHVITTTKVKMTNPTMKVTTEIRTDGKGPFFVADLADKKKIIFKTDGMEPMDVVMRFNRLLGNRELGNSGLRKIPE